MENRMISDRFGSKTGAKQAPGRPNTLDSGLLHVVFLIAALHGHPRNARQVDERQVRRARGVDRQDDGVVHYASHHFSGLFRPPSTHFTPIFSHL